MKSYGLVTPFMFLEVVLEHEQFYSRMREAQSQVTVIVDTCRKVIYGCCRDWLTETI